MSSSTSSSRSHTGRRTEFRPLPRPDREAAETRAAAGATTRSTLGVRIIFVACAVICLIDLAVVGPTPSSVTGFVATLAFLQLERFPTTTSIIVSACVIVSGVSVQVGGSTAVSMLMLALLVRRRRLVPVTILTASYLAYLAFVVPGVRAAEWTVFVRVVLLLFPILAISVGHVLYRGDERLDISTTARAQALRSQRLLIARELHDTITRANTEIVLRAEGARVAGEADPAVLTALEDIITTARQSVTDLRTMLRVLRQYGSDLPPRLLPVGDSDDLTTVVETASQRLTAHGMQVATTIDGEVGRLSRSLTGGLGRIIEECTANMIKYAAPGSRCSIQMEVREDEVGLLVVNPVAGRSVTLPDKTFTSTYGLLGIQERVTALDGQMSVAEAGSVWMLEVHVPVTWAVPPTP